MEKIRLIPTDSAEVEEFYVLDQAKLGGKTYLLVTDEEGGRRRNVHDPAG